jgi:hypothetical protein
MNISATTTLIHNLGDASVLVTGGGTNNDFSLYQAATYFSIGKYMFIATVFSKSPSDLNMLKRQSLALASQIQNDL